MAGHIRCAFRQFDTPTSNLGMTTHPRDLIKQNRNRNHHRGCLHIPSSPPPHTPGPDLESSAGPTAAGPRLLTEWHCNWYWRPSSEKDTVSEASEPSRWSMRRTCVILAIDLSVS